jgi:KDO2-lipid IV(A) lauroyltransferase
MYYILKFFEWFISLFPIKPLYSLSSSITSLIFGLWKEKRDNVHRNYSLILSKKFGRPATEKEIKDIMKENFKNYGMFNVEFLYMHKLIKMSALPPIRNMENIDKGLSFGKGMILCTIHFSNWDIAGSIISGQYKNKCEVWAIADDLGGGYSKFVQESRDRYGIKIILSNKNLRSAYECLKHNGLLNVLVDRPVPRSDKSGVEVEFFGKKTWVGSAAARIALKTGAKMLVGYAVRGSEGFYGQAGPMLNYELTGDKEKDVQIITQAAMREAEKLIMEHPEQWYMFRNMWT